jgi:homoserine kinase
MENVTVVVPASTSNLGPGFDCLGIALALHNGLTLCRARERVACPGIVKRAAAIFFKRSGARPFPFSATIDDTVPRSRGLGSSATARLGLLFGLNELTKRPLSRHDIFELAAQLEGHPDNAAPACFGGFTLVRPAGRNRLRSVHRFDVGTRVSFVLLIPETEVQTSKARKALPARVSRLDAVENVANACAITAAFASREYENLRDSFEDHLHQPFRSKLNPLLPRVVAAAEEAGAVGAFLSGSGSTICAITLQSARRVAEAMQHAAKPNSVRLIVTKADNHGARVRHS